MRNQVGLVFSLIMVLNASAAAMTPADREKVRFHLANAYNEADLLIRNHLSFERDVKRQEQDFKGMKVFERIPLTDNFQDLKDQLEDSAKQHHVELSFFQVGKRNPVDTSSIPKTIYSSDEFKIPSDKLVETIPLHLAFRGKEADIRKWISEWDDEVLRIVEPRGKIHAVRQGSGEGEFKLNAWTYRYTEVNYPELKPKDPVLFLPAWAQKNPEKFAREEPQLWSYVTRTREIYPTSSQYLKFRQRYLLNDARTSFYLAKTANPRTMGE